MPINEQTENNQSEPKNKTYETRKVVLVGTLDQVPVTKVMIGRETAQRFGFSVDAKGYHDTAPRGNSC